MAEFKQVRRYTFALPPASESDTFHQQYSTMQQGYIALEARCERRDGRIRGLKNDIRALNERYEEDTEALGEQLHNKDEELEKLKEELLNKDQELAKRHEELTKVLKISRAIEATIERASSTRRFRSPHQFSAHLPFSGGP